MNILVTGGFGNLGTVVVNECLNRGHKVSIFEVQTRRTEKLAHKYTIRNVKVWLGDLRKIDDIENAVAEQDAVIHLAAILPPISDANPELCKKVNIEGTTNLVNAMLKTAPRPTLVAVSSASVMGPTQNQTPPVRPNAPLNPTDTYSRSKAEAEAVVTASGLQYCILRLAAVMPSTLNTSMFNMIKIIYDMPLAARCEIILDIDAAYALASAAENLAESGEIAGNKGFIAGGKKQGCQIRIRDMLIGVFKPLGLPLPNESLFSPDLNSYYLDWYDTEEIQSILGYQRHSIAQWQEIMQKKPRLIRPFIFLFRPIVMKWLNKKARAT